MPSHLLVERALALIPDSEEFRPLSDAVIGTSRIDSEKVWARSGAYATVGKRVVDPAGLRALIPELAERAQQRLQRLFDLVLEAIQKQEEGDLAAAAGTLVRAGEMEEEDRRLDKAERIYGQALEIARDLREKGPQVLALRRLGRVVRAAGRLDEAWGWYERSYLLAVDEMDLAGQAVACQGLGNLCDDRGQREQAWTWYERGLRLARGLSDPGLEWPFHANLSILAMHRGELSRAEESLRRARACIEATGDEGGMLYWFNNRGLILMEGEDALGAEAMFREGLERCRNPLWEILLRVNLGDALARQDRFFEAEEEARRAEEAAIAHRYIPRLVEVYGLFGKIARRRCDEEGFVFFEQALNVCRERELPAVKEAGVYEEYGLLHLACGRRTEAEAYLEQARAVYRDLGLGRDLVRVDGELARARAVEEPKLTA
ncbi:MAG TPA: tetratricopeptide repeat protein [Longimicrobiaceae bacterium]|nr:tetratricopeptide repeat protein [Longimicrobiaceae bacterium]